MIESRRLAYLNALGVPQFVARVDIEGAPTLPELSEEQIWGRSIASESESSDAEIEQPVQNAAIAPNVGSSVAPSIDPSTQAAPSSEPAEQPPQTNQQVSDDGEPPKLDLSKLGVEKKPTQPVTKPVQQAVERFSLAIVTVPEQFRFVVQLGVADAPGLSAVEHRMLSDMLQALGFANWLNQHSPQAFQWPIVNNPRIAKDRAAARDGLIGFFSSAQALPKNIFLGQTAASILYEGELKLADSPQPIELSGLPGQTCVVPALHQMQDWQTKAQVWRTLQTFLR